MRKPKKSGANCDDGIRQVDRGPSGSSTVKAYASAGTPLKVLEGLLSLRA